MSYDWNLSNLGHAVPCNRLSYLNRGFRSIDVIDFDSAPRIGILNYNTTGEADDWMLGRKGIISMSPEIGDERYGFWPPGNAITKINQQAFWHIIEVVMKTGSGCCT